MSNEISNERLELAAKNGVANEEAVMAMAKELLALRNAREGWKLVPLEPTKGMNKAGWRAMNEHDAINPAYRAMLAAAPEVDDDQR